MNYFARRTISRRAALRVCRQFRPAYRPANNQRGDMRRRSVYAPVLASAEHRILRTIVHALCYEQTIAILRFMNRKTFSRPRDQEVLMRDQAYLYIQRKILAGDLQAGKAVSELTIAKELGSSRTPIREALGQLVAEGLLEQIPNRGAVVVQFGRQDIIDLFELREALEAFAVEKIARARIRRADLDRLQSLADEIFALKNELDRSGRETLNSSQRQQFVRSDMGFHALLIQMAENPRISKVVNSTRLLIRFFATRSLPKETELEWIYQQHSEVLQAVAAQDPEHAVRIIRKHIQTSLKDRLEEFDYWRTETLLGDHLPAFAGEELG
jgi:DNA-binding GntR family transcriptional regulator